MKFPLPTTSSSYNSASRGKHFSRYYRQKYWWKQYCAFFKKQPKYSFKTHKTKLKSFDKWILFVFTILLITAVMIVKSVLHLYTSHHHNHELRVLEEEVTANVNNNDIIFKITPKLEANTLTLDSSNWKEKQEMYLNSLDLQSAQNDNNNNNYANNHVTLSYNNGFNDWWKFPKMIESEMDSKSKATEYKAFSDLQNYRKTYMEQRLISKEIASIKGYSNEVTYQSKCVEYASKDAMQWKPDNNALCPWTNTALFWTAMDGTETGNEIRRNENILKEHTHWMYAFKDFINSENCICPQNTIFLFWNNIQINKDVNKGKSMFGESMQNCGHCKYLVYDITPNERSDFERVDSIEKWLDSDEFSDISNAKSVEYLMIVFSGDDTTLKLISDNNIDFEKELIDRFEYYDCDLLLCGFGSSYPNYQRTQQTFENDVYKWSRHHQHVNADILMAKGGVDGLKTYLDLLRDDFEKSDKTKWSFNAAVRDLHMKYYPKIKVDSLAKIWTRVDFWMFDP